MRADTHNFGRHVYEIDDAGQSYFIKPRTLFWEYFLASQNSPLRPIFNFPLKFTLNDERKITINPAGVFFKLNIEGGYPFDVGRSLKIDQTKKISDATPIEFGFILGYAYAFGIQDLHYQNIVHSNSPTVVDIEVVLSNLTLPNESLLLPIDASKYQIAGISSLYEKHELTLKNVILICKGFLAILEFMATKLKPIIEVFKNNEHLQKVPIRIIFRNTADYYKYPNHKFPKPLFSEEITQLERKDIPYFFKFMGISDVYWYRKEGGFDNIKVPEYFNDVVQKTGVDYQLLLSKKRIKEYLIPVGLLYILKHYIPYQYVGSFKADSFECSLDLQKIKVRLKNLEYVADRSKKDQDR